MNLKKPKFWDYKKPNFFAYVLYPLTILINFLKGQNLFGQSYDQIVPKKYILEHTMVY